MGSQMRDGLEAFTGEIYSTLPTFTLLQVSERGNEFRAVPGPDARAARAKIMRHTSPSGVGGQAILFIGTESCSRRGVRLDARWARLILRMPNRISGRDSFPADAFCAPCPCFRATRKPLRRRGNAQSEGSKCKPLLTNLDNLDSVDPANRNPMENRHEAKREVAHRPATSGA
jgi:hypothetical protein